jgi:hypothetical protein
VPVGKKGAKSTSDIDKMYQDVPSEGVDVYWNETFNTIR